MPIRALFANLQARSGIAPQDVESTLFQTPRENRGICGHPEDDLGLSNKVEV